MKILVIDDNFSMVTQIKNFLMVLKHECAWASSAEEGIAENKRQMPQLVLVEIELGPRAGIDLLGALLRDNPGASVVILTAHASVPSAVEALKNGASDYLQKPFLDAPVDLKKLLELISAHLGPRAGDAA